MRAGGGRDERDMRVENVDGDLLVFVLIGRASSEQLLKLIERSRSLTSTYNDSMSRSLINWPVRSTAKASETETKGPVGLLLIRSHPWSVEQATPSNLYKLSRKCNFMGRIQVTILFLLEVVFIFYFFYVPYMYRYIRRSP